MAKPVLIIEDEEVLLRNLVGSLARAGVEAVGAPSIARAREMMAEHRFTLLCVDIRLGDGDGIELISGLRDARPDLPVIVMTGQDCVANRLRAERIDASAFMAKPFALSRFRELVATLLHETSAGGTPPEPARRAPSVMMYSHDTIGLGHMRRNSAIASEIVTAMPEASVLMLVGSPAGVVFDLSPGVDFIKLPSLAKVSRNVWRPGSLRISSSDTRDIRAGLIQRAVETFRPDLLLVDHEPLGVWDELVPTLEAMRACSGGPRIVLGLRDILDEPARTRADWQRRGLTAQVRDFYDDILIYGSAEVFDSERAYGLDDLAPGRVRYCGYVTASSAHGRRPPAPERHRDPAIVVAGGGGRDAYPMMCAALDALANLPPRFRRNAVLISGPLMDEELRARLDARARSAGVSFLTSTPDVPALLREADLFVAMGGYNSLTEALRTGCPTLVIPRIGPSSEQRMRAELFAARGLVETIPQEEATSAVLAERFGEVRPGAARRHPDIDLGGGAAAASHITEILSGRHPDSLVVGQRNSVHA